MVSARPASPPPIMATLMGLGRRGSFLDIELILNKNEKCVELMRSRT